MKTANVQKAKSVQPLSVKADSVALERKALERLRWTEPPPEKSRFWKNVLDLLSALRPSWSEDQLLEAERIGVKRREQTERFIFKTIA